MTSPIEVVIVEDDPDTAEMFAEMVRMLGYRVIKSHGSILALNVIAEKRPQVVILDVMLPDLCGLEVLRFMRRDPRLADIPVVIVSALALPDDIRSGMEAGASVYLTKPVAVLELQNAIKKAVHGRTEIV